jgi:hypothetical protein
METKPKSVKLVNFEEEQLPTGRKLLHCIFQNRYGAGFQYKWTAPWRDKEGEHGVEKLFFRCLATEEWNDYDGVWSGELTRAAKRVPSLEEMKLPVRIGMDDVREEVKKEPQGKSQEYWVICVTITGDELPVVYKKADGEQHIVVGSVSMAWERLKEELFHTNQVPLLSREIESILTYDYDMQRYEETGIKFWVWVNKATDKTEYEVSVRQIASCIRRFIRTRLSDYKAIKRGFEEEDDSGDKTTEPEDIPFD